MARITVEDCIRRVPNRFHLVQMAAIRAKQIKRGSQPLIPAAENKEVVTALREIAAGFIQADYPPQETK
jgi:DNA-directed RNA polymerase subunit omega